jgi:hypothetical protein
MKAFKGPLCNKCGADYAMAIAVAITFAVIAASAHLRSTSAFRGSPPAHAVEGYRGPRA